MDLNDKPMATYEDMDAEQRNIGSGLTAILLREIAETGQHHGVFGGKEQEAAAQAILELHKLIHEMAGRYLETGIKNRNKAVADCAEFVRNSPGRFGPNGRRDQLANDMRKALTIETI